MVYDARFASLHPSHTLNRWRALEKNEKFN